MNERKELQRLGSDTEDFNKMCKSIKEIADAFNYPAAVFDVNLKPKRMIFCGLRTIAEHTVDLSLINRDSKVLDLGCRAFTWSKAMLEYVDEVYCVDADPAFTANKPEGPGYKLFLGAVSDTGGKDLALYTSGNGTGNYVDSIDNIKPWDKWVPTKSFTLKEISGSCNIEMWDVIKFDIESSEVPVLLSLTEPPAKQLSIEFHMHTGTTEETILKVFEHLKQWYDIVFVDKSEKHGCGMNYWDVLFIDKLTEATRLFKRNVGNYK
jgi:hypothetical protein